MRTRSCVRRRSLVLGDLRSESYDGTPQIALPLAALASLTRLVVPADFLLVPSVLAALAEACAKLPALASLELPRMVLTPHRVAELTAALSRCATLRALALGGAGAPMMAGDLGGLINGE
jgi:hypothetical protein